MQKYIVLTLDKLVHTIERELNECCNADIEVKIRDTAEHIVAKGFWTEDGMFYTGQAIIRIHPIKD